MYVYAMTSTHFEDVVYPDVNDYYQYFSAHFNYPDYSFYTPQGGLVGYQKAIFFQMIQKKYGTEPLRRAWENMKTEPPAAAINDALLGFSTDYSNELCCFARWCYNTGYRAYDQDPAERFDEAERFPLIQLEGQIQLSAGPGKAVFNGELPPYGSHYYTAYRGADTVRFAVTNSDFAAADSDSARYDRQPYTITVLGYLAIGSYISLQNGWSYKFETPRAGTLCIAIAIDEEIQGIEDLASGNAESSPYPNPFLPERDHEIRFPLPFTTAQTSVLLYIYSANMDLIYNAECSVIDDPGGDGRYIRWNGIMADGCTALSGIYVFTIRYGDDEYQTGKFAVINR
jgi:hypothetical protein